MTASPTDTFLSGQGIPVEPGRVEDELDDSSGARRPSEAPGPELDAIPT